jgi:HlyD family secretion protein
MKMAMKIYLFSLLVIILLGCNNASDKDVIETSGIIEATEVIVSSKVNSQVLYLFCDEGSKVSRGDTLAILDNEYYRFQYEQALALETSAKAQYELVLKGARKEDIIQAQEALAQAEETFQIAKTNYERFKNLKASQSVSEKQYEEAELNYKFAHSRLLQAKENLQKLEKLFRKEEIAQAEANWKRAQANSNLFRKYLSDCIIISPSDGVVLQKFIEAGENVNPGTPLFKIAKLDTMEMIVYVPESDIGKIHLGQDVDVTCDSYPNKVYSGKVVFISEQSEFTPKSVQTKDERVTLVFAVKIKIPNPNFELKSGLPADAKITLANSKK